jgi:putative ABC transport system permease protein
VGWHVRAPASEPGRSGEAVGDDLNVCGADVELAAADRDEERTRSAVAEAVTTKLDGAGVEVEGAESISDQEDSIKAHQGPIALVLVAGAIAMGVVGGIGLASTMGANILERIREFGVMHAIGARPTAVRRIVVAEGIFTAIASWLLAIIPALGLTAIMGSVVGNTFMSAPLPFRISAFGVGIWSVLVVLGAVLATDAAATRASRLTVREALAYL